MPSLPSLPFLRRSRRGCRVLSIVSLFLALLLYAASPLATLWRAADGIGRHDPEALRVALDWGAVRDNLRHDLADRAPLSLADATAPMDELPAFGHSFVKAVVSNAIDSEMTPERLLARLSSGGASGHGGTGLRSMLDRIAFLRFVGPERFEAGIRITAGARPTMLSLHLSRWRWRITHVRLPDAPIRGAFADSGRT